MGVTKDARLVYVAAIPKERSGIGRDVPAHVKIVWEDSKGRKNARLMDLWEDEIAAISDLPDLP